MPHLTPPEYDRLERAVDERRRIAVVRGGRETVVIPIRLFLRDGRETIAARHPSTGEEMLLDVLQLDRIDVIP